MFFASGVRVIIRIYSVGTVEKTKAAIDEIIQETGNSNVEFIQGDFMDLKSVIDTSVLTLIG